MSIANFFVRNHKVPNAYQFENLRSSRKVDVLASKLMATKDPLHAASLMVTSANEAQVQQSLAASLAIKFAEYDQRTVLIELNDQTLIKSQGDAKSILEVLSADDVSIDDALQTSEYMNLSILHGDKTSLSWQVTKGTSGENRFTLLLQQLAERFDWIIVVPHPLTQSDEAVVLANSVKRALLVLRRDQTRVDEVDEAVATLSAAKVEIIGSVIFNR